MPDQDKHLQDMLEAEFADFVAILNAQAQVTTFYCSADSVLKKSRIAPSLSGQLSDAALNPTHCFYRSTISLGRNCQESGSFPGSTPI
jgi:hypothetical protein